MYCDYWREKLKNKPTIKFPKQLSPAIAAITKGFSFAYLKEAFVSTLIVIAGNRSEDRFGDGNDDDNDSLDDCELWREIKKQIKLLRDDIGNTSPTPSSPETVSTLPLQHPHHYHRPRGVPRSIPHSLATTPPHDMPLAPFSLPYRGGRPGESSAGKVDRTVEGIPLILDSGNIAEGPGRANEFTFCV